MCMMPALPETAPEIIELIDQALRTEPERSRGRRARFALVVDGNPWHIVLDDELGGHAGSGVPERPQLTIIATERVFVDIAHGRRNPTKAYVTGALKVVGKLELLGMLQEALR